jgi:hypothetical protein
MKRKSSLFVNKKFKIAIALLVGVYSTHLIKKSYEKKTDGFKVESILSNIPFYPQFVTQEPSSSEMETIDQILDQPFYYLGKGYQCFAFESADRCYVIKFCRHSRLRNSYIYDHIPLPQFLDRKRKLTSQKKTDKLLRHLSSYKFAFENLKEEAALIFMHLNKSSNLSKTLTFFDKIGSKFTLNMDHVEFFIQKKINPFYPTLEKMIVQGDHHAVRSIIDDLMQILVKRSNLGMCDKDAKLDRNFGILDGRVHQIDIGSYRPIVQEITKDFLYDDIKTTTSSLKKWLHEKEPSLGAYLDQKVNELKL